MLASLLAKSTNNWIIDGSGEKSKGNMNSLPKQLTAVDTKYKYAT